VGPREGDEEASGSMKRTRECRKREGEHPEAAVAREHYLQRAEVLYGGWERRKPAFVTPGS
jgi:hypothetical protein